MPWETDLVASISCVASISTICYKSSYNVMMTLEPTTLTEQDKAIARQSFRLLNEHQGAKGLPVFQVDGVSVPLPNSFLGIVGECLDMLANGHRVAVVPMDEEIGTQEAADMLGVSRPYLVKLLDSNALPSRKVGVQRRVRIDDLKAYKAREKAARKKVLIELAAEDQRLHLGA